MTLPHFQTLITALLSREYTSRYGCPPPAGTAWQHEAWVAPFLRLMTAR